MVKDDFEYEYLKLGAELARENGIIEPIDGIVKFTDSFRKTFKDCLKKEKVYLTSIAKAVDKFGCTLTTQEKMILCSFSEHSMLILTPDLKETVEEERRVINKVFDTRQYESDIKAVFDDVTDIRKNR